MLTYKRLSEAFESRRVKEGVVQFKNRLMHDPHIKAAIDLIDANGFAQEELILRLYARVEKVKEMAKISPVLYGTIEKNVIEDFLFTHFWETEGLRVKNAPKFSNVWFKELIDHIRAEHASEFNPMRGFMDSKRLREIEYILLPRDADRYPQYKSVTTAAATPKGKFIFNEIFMQKLMDWAHLEGVKPKGKKYVCNGGEIPDEYCYIEFLILHEFMHYSNDDFHYQKVIKGADPKIINWVGDFRSNYLLVKSGYEQLPMGLFSDKVNFDRQQSYREMYDLVKSELEKFENDDDGGGEETGEGGGEGGGEGSGEGEDGPPPRKKKKGKGKSKGGRPTREDAERELDNQADEHDPGNDEGQDMDEGEDMTEEELDKQAKEKDDRFKQGKDLSKKEADAVRKAQGGRGQHEAGGQANRIEGNSHEIEISTEKPRNWSTLIRLFINSAQPTTEENWTKPKWSHTMGKGGGSAPISGKATERPQEVDKVNLAFVVDSSGSMGGVISRVYSNIIAVLKSRQDLSTAVFTFMRFSAETHVYKGIFKTNKAVLLNDVDEQYTSMPLELEKTFKEHYGSVTNFDDALTNQILKMLKKKGNVIIFSDQDITSGYNLANLEKVLKDKSGGKVFVIFDTKTNYEHFKKNSKMVSTFMSYIDED